jgi:Flp pilus assembly protein TadD
MARCHLLSDRVDDAITCLRKSLAGNRQLYYVHMLLAAALGLKGDLREAGVALRQAVEMHPGMASVSAMRNLLVQYASPRFMEMWENTICVGLRRAGLPE